MSETRERFLREIITRVPAEHIEEIHFFPPIRQSGVESGVAVVAVSELSDRESDGGTTRSGDQDRESDGGTPGAADGSSPAVAAPPGTPAPEVPPSRYAVYTARYRYVLKGPDRGKWDAQLQVEADAPLVTVEAVVRGVQRRSGDAEDPERMSGDDVRAFAATQPVT